MEIEFIVDRFEGDKVVLKSENSPSVVWPKEKLPENIHEGSIIYFNISNNKKEEDKKRKQAKDILNELLNVE